MTEQVSVTIPMEVSALRRAITMLEGMAEDLGQPVAATIEQITEAGNLSQSATDVFDPKPATTVTVTGTVQPVMVKESTPVTIAETPVTAQHATAPASSVDLDGEGLPWDVRIHSSSQTKLSKNPNGWKKKRGVDPALVATVEAELRAALAAGTPAPVQATVQPVTPAPVQADGVKTFPELMAGITGNNILQEVVNAGLTAISMPSLPLLAARPDLIPEFAKSIGL